MVKGLSLRELSMKGDIVRKTKGGEKKFKRRMKLLTDITPTKTMVFLYLKVA